ncbi:tripartite tricarboxylate transporter substrate binding protein [Candidimonas humi]|uniref:Bug family tripartite tricarboxylate transporter substrate binding protein n=1 Tax=Candidimonas humi TaxID=683355 RepID=UPI001C3EFC61|nr:tripartite tricarboxylate transporter substrate binding protein [Candidimonas humi]MBV6305896.1 tripartite tricarboxylate transporter substrate binding protein [Candidimonas humi]
MNRYIRALSLAAGLLAIPFAQAADKAADYPNHPVRWIVPFTPGGAMDNIARTLSDAMTASTGQSFIVENRPGAGGNVGAAYVARSPADGYTIMIVANGMAVNPYLYKSLRYDPVKDFTPVSLLAVVPNVLVTNPKYNHAKTVADVIAQAKAEPGKHTFASAGVGTSIHLAGELFVKMTGVSMMHIPYKGSSPAMVDLLGGRVDYMFDSITSSKPHIDSGELTAIAVTTSKRSPTLPNVPTVAESGVPGYVLTPWFAAFAPAGTPPEIVAKLNKAMLDAMKTPKVRATLDFIGAEPIGSTPEELRAYLASEMKAGKELVQSRGIHLD